MTLRKQNTKQTTRHKLTRAVKPLFKPKPTKPAKPAAKPVVVAPDPKAVEQVAKADQAAFDREHDRRVTVSSIAREAKKASRSLDGLSAAKPPLPSASARPIITNTTPQTDNTIASPSGPTVIDVSRPAAETTMIHKRTMMSQPPAAMTASDDLQAAGNSAAAGTADSGLDAPKQTGRPAKPLLTKPVAAGPTVAELLSKQHEAAEDSADPSETPVVVTAAPTATVSTAVKVDDVKPVKAPSRIEPLSADVAGSNTDSDETEVADTDQVTEDKADEPVNPKPQLVTLAKPKSDTADEAETAPETAVESESDTETEAKPETPAVAATPKPDVAEAADKPAEADDDVSGASTEEKSEPDGMSTLQGDVKTEKAEPTPPPKAELYGGRPVIIIHEAHPVREFLVGLLVFVIGLAVLAAAVNFLLDADIIHTGYKIPHTNILDPK